MLGDQIAVSSIQKVFAPGGLFSGLTKLRFYAGDYRTCCCRNNTRSAHKRIRYRRDITISIITAANTTPPYDIRMAARLCHTGPNRVQMAHNKEAQKEAQQTTPRNNMTQVIGAVHTRAAYIVFAQLAL
jgi:hypothetical protein